MSKLVKILSIDGGGVRGVIPAIVLTEIERRTGKPIAHLFDLIAGTSTGSLLALALNVPGKNGKPKHKAEDVAQIYEKDGERLFHRTTLHKIDSVGGVMGEKYSTQSAKKVFEKYGSGARLADAFTEILIPSFELGTNLPFFFKRREARANKQKNFLMSDVALATSAAPTYFAPYTIEPTSESLIKHLSFIDGGVYANNPALCAYTEAKEIFPNAKGYLLVSLGTGQMLSHVLYEQVKNWGTVHWLKPILQVIFAGITQSTDHQLRALVSAESDQLKYYYRLQPIVGQASVDDASYLTVHIHKLIAEDLIRDNDELLNSICKQLT